jgi:hypothetical protein
MDPIDPALIDYRMAKALRKLGQSTQARHHVLRAILEAPRYRDAHQLLLKLAADDVTQADKPQAEASSGSGEGAAANATGDAESDGGQQDVKATPGSNPEPLKSSPSPDETGPADEQRQTLGSKLEKEGSK